MWGDGKWVVSGRDWELVKSDWALGNVLVSGIGHLASVLCVGCRWSNVCKE